ncbi:glycosyltransferase [Thermomonospora cellulosilytica]|uniref:Cellulose synthase/poly-beta-1,6-N-acetylglucosamine synthase-like glycosyltransferase n=1 Tax=Thermomonospora cellulosilytica TaxID=1411118 RepID=A0A7W3MWS0_9ACTN|nr:glycosyltransferase family 2 protein [Thermomonospora cellulosilytica]MBA9003311.1 cellulose synthase/poly-beta-1,6-N-acetylglucosamine synthase-like glycosyltransferase [Thermomonospora cellulosilytica]
MNSPSRPGTAGAATRTGLHRFARPERTGTSGVPSPARRTVAAPAPGHLAFPAVRGPGGSAASPTTLPGGRTAAPVAPARPVRRPVAPPGPAPAPARAPRRDRDGKRGQPPVNPAEMRVTVLIPAHNEADQITETIASLRRQERPPDDIVVIADNCTDATAALARLCGAEIVGTRGNRHKKAGALNQVLDRLLPILGPTDAVMVMDADSALDPGFIRHGLAYLAGGRYAAVGGTFTGKPGGGVVGMFQRNEYARYARDVRRLKGKALVLTGTATIFRATTLQEVVAARRERRLPGLPHVYDVRVLTEDNELTLAILHLGFRILCPRECTLTTEVMLTWRDLARQRLRWKRGALENLVDYGWTPITRPYWGRQLLSLIGILVIAAYLLSLACSVIWLGGIRISPLWGAVTVIFMVERVVTVRRRGRLQMAIAAVIVVEMVFDVFLQIVQARAFWEAAWRKERKW